jgi:chromate transport protein ChrA
MSGNSMMSMIQTLATGIGIIVATMVLGLFERKLGMNNISIAFRTTFIIMGLITAFSTAIFGGLRDRKFPA